MYIYISNILYPIWKYTHKGFHPSTPQPMLGPCARGAGGRGAWGGEEWGEPLMGISILDIGYLFIQIYTPV